MDLNEIVSKIDNLEEKTPAQWGVMTAQHMVEHLIDTLYISSRPTDIEAFNPPEKQGVMKKFLFSDKPMPRNFKSPAMDEAPKPLKYDSFEKAVDVFKDLYDQFHTYFKENPDAKLTNPAFGDLDYNEWKQFHKKHITHHFTQFGLIED